MNQLGSLRVSISSRGEAEEKKVSQASITGAKTVFTPGSELKKMLNELKYEKL